MAAVVHDLEEVLREEAGFGRFALKVGRLRAGC